MRNQLIDKLTEEAVRDPRIVLLTADLGFGVIEGFAKRHPDRFVNVGVTEQAMIALATGLAHSGMIPYCYSIATFASLRALEFIRNGPVAHRLPVRVIGIGPGFDYENDGITHFAVDDLAALRVQPGLSIWAPADEQDFAENFTLAHRTPGPVYIRIPRHPIPPLLETNKNALESSDGIRVLVLSFGDARSESKGVMQSLFGAGVIPDYAEAFWINNQSRQKIMELASSYDVCVTVETHYDSGGFGSWVLELVQMLDSPPRVITHGITSLPVGPLGSRSWLTKRHMTDPEITTQRVLSVIRNLL